MKYLLFSILFFLSLGHAGWAQEWSSRENTFDTNWSFTVQTGRTALLSEVHTDFSGSSNDMNNQSDWGFNLQLGKMIWNRLDLGFEFGVSNYKGFKDASANVNMLMYHMLYNSEETGDFEPYPIYYDSDLTNLTIFFRYNFVNFQSHSRGYLNLNLYLKLGVGVAFPSAELGYKSWEHYELTGLKQPLYLKGRYPNRVKDMHNFFSPALGLNYQLNEQLFFSAETSFQLIGADNIDGIHNYSRELEPWMDGPESHLYRIRVYDLTAKFLVGLTWYFNFDSKRAVRQEHVPWFRHKSRTYYSKYHESRRKGERREDMPWR